MLNISWCVCHNCPNRLYATNSSVSYHSFPDDPELRKKWLENIGKKDMVVTTQSKLCSIHFKESFIKRTSDTVTLNDDALPTEFIQNPFSTQMFKYAFEIDPSNLFKSFNVVKDQSDHTEIDFAFKNEMSDDNAVEQYIDPLDVTIPAILTIEFLTETIEQIIQLLEKITTRDTDRLRGETVKTGVLNAISCYQEMIDSHQKQFLIVELTSPECTSNNEVSESKTDSVSLEDNSVSKPKEGKKKLPTPNQKGAKRQCRENKNQTKICVKSKRKIQKKPDENIKSDIEILSEVRANKKRLKKSKLIKEQDPADTGKESCADEGIKLMKRLQNETQSQETSTKTKRKRKVYPRLVSYHNPSKVYNLDTPLVRYTCQECDISFMDPVYLDGHWKQCKGRKIRTWGVQPEGDGDVQYEDGKFRCPLCPKTYSSRFNLQRHIIMHEFYQIQNDKNKMNKLISARKDPSLDENDKSNASGDTNDFDKIESIESKCSELNDSSKTRQVTQSGVSLSDSSNDKFEPASDIIEGSTSKDGLKYSLSRVVSEVPASEEMLEESVQCDQCDRSYKTRSALAFHVQYVHKDDGYAIVCNHCPTMFKTAHFLVFHVKRKHRVTISDGHNYYMVSSEELKKYTYPKEIELRVFMCKVCSKIFPTPKQLKLHSQGNCSYKISKPKISRGFNKVEGKYVCKICGKSYGSYAGIHQHTVYHNNDILFECDICGHRSTSKGSLYMHIKTHSKTRNYICEECGKTFTNPNNLKRHKMAHAGHKPYKCEICGKVFQFAYITKVHMRTHTGEKPYACDMCPQKFSDRRGCLAHVNKHKGIKPYKCEQCDATFLLRKSLNKHVLEHSDCRTKYDIKK